MIASVLVDFDGTACPHDVSAELLGAFASGDWRAHDLAVDRGEIGLREAAGRQAAMLRANEGEMLAYALDRFAVDPTFPPFVAWAESRAMPVAVVSDGFGFHVGPILAAAGLGRLTVLTNEYGADGGLRHPNGHPVCGGCGTCKMLAAASFRERHGSVAFVGEGRSDRYGALYADLVFAKDALVEICRRDGVPSMPWQTFDDVRTVLESGPGPSDRAMPSACPGWRTAKGSSAVEQGIRLPPRTQ